MSRNIKTVAERLLSRRSIDERGCWNWMGAKTPKGYGQIRLPLPATAYTHREAYIAWVGPIPNGLHIDHLCRNRGCFNPAHLEPVTPRTNARRGQTGAHLRRKAA